MRPQTLSAKSSNSFNTSILRRRRAPGARRRRAAGARAARAQSGARRGLDYAGVDFGLLPDGRVLVFEANATMLVHPEPEGCFAYRNPAVQAIQRAFMAMLDARRGDRGGRP